MSTQLFYASAATGAQVGTLLQYWRKTRSLSQLALAHEAEVSPRHICFLETGRAKPSREMVMLLSMCSTFLCASATCCCSPPALRLCMQRRGSKRRNSARCRLRYAQS
ncbi:helix-turn-helix transcriptional regulator [Neomesorhizobium albiziae]